MAKFVTNRILRARAIFSHYTIFFSFIAIINKTPLPNPSCVNGHIAGSSRQLNTPYITPGLKQRFAEIQHPSSLSSCRTKEAKQVMPLPAALTSFSRSSSDETHTRANNTDFFTALEAEICESSHQPRQLFCFVCRVCGDGRTRK